MLLKIIFGILLAWPVLTGCARLATHREIVWAQIGTPARITDERSVQVLIPDGAGGWLPGEAVLRGMIAMDEPTLEYYQQLDEP